MRKNVARFVFITFLSMILTSCATTGKERTFPAPKGMDEQFIQICQDIQKERLDEFYNVNYLNTINRYTFTADSSASETKKNLSSSIINNSLTKSQAKSDVTLLFDLLKSSYAAYLFYGAENFAKAKASALEKIDASSDWTTNTFINILKDSLSFITDKHFTINESAVTDPNLEYIYRYNTDIVFTKEDDGFHIQLDGMDKVFDANADDRVSIQRTLTETGEILYCPTLFCMRGESEEHTRLTFTDSSTLNIQWMDIGRFKKSSSKYSFKQYNGLFYIYLSGFRNALDAQGYRDFENTGRVVRNSDFIILDLRQNGGGQLDHAQNWFRNYAGRDPVVTALETPPGANTITGSSRAIIQNNETPIIILVNQYTGSTSENMICYLKTLTNVIVVGSNTKGCFAFGGPTMYLPNSGVSVKFGSHFEAVANPQKALVFESMGLTPDIWCDPSVALDYVLAMYGHYSDDHVNVTQKDLRNVRQH